MLIDPVIAMLHNNKTGRFHPILFDERPYPGPDAPDKPRRHKSRGHHTLGFDTRELAVEGAKGEALGAKIKSEFGIEPKYCLDEDIPWDGEETPAMVLHFIESNGVLKIAF